MATVEECTYPDLFSRVTMKCDRFEQVDCDHRPEPQAPCEYINRRKLDCLTQFCKSFIPFYLHLIVSWESVGKTI